MAIRILYVAYKRGLVVEMFKLVGIIFSCFITLHYYVRISDVIISKTTLPVEVADVFILIVFSLLIVLLFKLIRDGFLILFKIEPTSIIDKWCALILGALRALFVSSLILVVLFSTNIDYLKGSINSSYGASKLIQLAPRAYAFCFEKAVVKFFPDEKLNTHLFEEISQ